MNSWLWEAWKWVIKLVPRGQTRHTQSPGKKRKEGWKPRERRWKKKERVKNLNDLEVTCEISSSHFYPDFYGCLRNEASGMPVESVDSRRRLVLSRWVTGKRVFISLSISHSINNTEPSRKNRLNSRSFICQFFCNEFSLSNPKIYSFPMMLIICSK